MVLLLCMSCRIDGLLEIFESTLGDIDGKKKFSKLLLNHSNVVNDGFIVRMNVQGLYAYYQG